MERKPPRIRAATDELVNFIGAAHPRAWAPFPSASPPAGVRPCSRSPLPTPPSSPARARRTPARDARASFRSSRVGSKQAWILPTLAWVQDDHTPLHRKHHDETTRDAMANPTAFGGREKRSYTLGPTKERWDKLGCLAKKRLLECPDGARTLTA
eukprot:scaffold240_cov369-Pavlova_lutheri.AAC.7